MSSKWTERFLNLFKIEEHKKETSLKNEQSDAIKDNPKAVLAHKIMRVMIDPDDRVLKKHENKNKSKPKP
jgi:hypothetical protein